ncbi:MAG: efflux RND transporter permease subunit, partial [Myxococcota bacterium]
AQIEEQITQPLEESIRELTEIKTIRSISQPGVSTIHVEVLDRFFELDDIWTDLREQLDLARSQFPQGTQGPIVNDDFGDVSVVTATLTGEDFETRELRSLRSRTTPARLSKTNTL